MRVRTPRAGRRVPPVLHVAFLELPGGRPQDLRPRLLRGAVDQGHHVLELVAEAVGPARLVERRPAPDPAGQHLVEQPAVEHQVQRRVGRAAPGRRRGCGPTAPGPPPAPAAPGRGRCRTARAAAPRPRSPPGRGRRRPRPPRRGAARAASSARRRGRTARRRGRQSRARPRAAGAAGEPLRPRNSVRSAVTECGRRPTAAKATWPAKSPAQALRASRAPALRVALADDLQRGLVAERAQHPLGVERRRQPPRPVAGVADRQADQLDRVVGRDEHQQLLLQPVAACG